VFGWRGEDRNLAPPLLKRDDYSSETIGLFRIPRAARLEMSAPYVTISGIAFLAAENRELEAGSLILQI
jgi:hypothetical protein